MPIEISHAVRTVARTSVAEMTGDWWVAQVRPRYEAKAAREMAIAGVDHFLPIERIRYVRKDREGRSEERDRLLFPGYLFVNGDANARYEIASSPHVSRVLPVVRRDRLSKQLADIERAMDAGAHLETFPGLHVGLWCRVHSGPLFGIEGRLVERQDGAKRFVIKVDILGQSVGVQVPPELLEAA